MNQDFIDTVPAAPPQAAPRIPRMRRHAWPAAHPDSGRDDDDLACARGILLALALVLGAWAVAAALWLWVAA